MTTCDINIQYVMCSLLSVNILTEDMHQVALDQVGEAVDQVGVAMYPVQVINGLI